MTYLKEMVDLGAESANETETSDAVLDAQLHKLRKQLEDFPDNAGISSRTKIHLDITRTLVALGRGVEAWASARPMLETYITANEWEHAAEACELLSLAEQPGSLIALGHGIWLAVTYPVDPELSVALLQRIVDETPDESDGAAVAVATAAYIVNLRAEGTQGENLQFFVQQLLGSVARRHSKVENQSDFDKWMEKLELNDPDQFLPRLRNIVDVLVQDDWWFDRAALQAQIPEEY